jgi:hypothetical protein
MILLQHGVDPALVNHRQATCLHVAAAQNETARAVLTTLKLHAAPKLPHLLGMKDDTGRTPLLIAASDGTSDMVDDLGRLSVEHHLLNVSDGDGYTAVHLAIWPQPRLQVLDVLLRLHPDLNVRNKAGKTPLHLALEVQSEEAVRRLLAFGPDLSVRDHRGNTVLHLAAAAGLENLANDLVQAGADTHAANTDGQLPSDIARLCGHSALAFRLLPQHFECGHCQKHLKGQLNTCSGCFSRSYCSPECQVRVLAPHMHDGDFGVVCFRDVDAVAQLVACPVSFAPSCKIGRFGTRENASSSERSTTACRSFSLTTRCTALRRGIKSSLAQHRMARGEAQHMPTQMWSNVHLNWRLILRDGSVEGSGDYLMLQQF